MNVEKLRAREKTDLPKGTEPMTGRAGCRNLGACGQAMFPWQCLSLPTAHSATSPQQLNVYMLANADCHTYGSEDFAPWYLQCLIGLSWNNIFRTKADT